MCVGVLVAAGFLTLVRWVNHRPPPDQAERFRDVAPFVEFTEVGRDGWVGRVDAGWPGLTDPAAAEAACAALLLRLAPTATQTVLLLGPDGLPVRECLPPGAQ